MPATPGPSRPVAVVLEAGARWTFASALDWPGWARRGRGDPAALEALAAAAPRYRVVAETAGAPFPTAAALGIEVVERCSGSATTDFGAPGAMAAGEEAPLAGAEAQRRLALLRAAWTVLDTVAAGAPPTLRRGPRGGGRDRDQIVDHVLGGETAYAAKLGLRLRPPSRDDASAVAAHRRAIADGLLHPPPPGRVRARPWPVRYAIRRLAWHVLDHAWEIEDRTEPAPR